MNNVRNGAFSQKFGGMLKYFAKSYNMRTSLKIRFYGTIWVQEENIQIQNEVWGLKTPHRPLCEIYKLSTLLMRWYDLKFWTDFVSIDLESGVAVSRLKSLVWCDGKTLRRQVKHWVSQPPPSYPKYVSFYNFWHVQDCPILIYLVCMDLE